MAPSVAWATHVHINSPGTMETYRQGLPPPYVADGATECTCLTIANATEQQSTHRDFPISVRMKASKKHWMEMDAKAKGCLS